MAAQQAAEKGAVARLLQTHPGVGPIKALTFSLALGKIERFAHSRQVVSYLGLNPAEYSSGSRRQLGGISKQGNSHAVQFARGIGTERGTFCPRVEARFISG